MVYIEPSFPRGRKAVDNEDNRPQKRIKKNTDYGASTATDEKLQKPRQKERQLSRIEQMEQDKDDLQQSIRAANLQFKTAREGMLVLGCVYKIQQMELTISLPGRIFGTVSLRSISEAYTNRLQSLLHSSATGGEERCPGLADLYSVGDLVYVKIKANPDKDRKFELTLNPSELHSEFNHKHLVEGLVLSATVEEKEDHGYQMNVGIKNVRAFLPAQNVNKNKTEVGSNVYCAVEKITKANGCATAILRAFKPTEPRKLEITEVNIDALVPGSVVIFSVESVLKNGLQGTLFDDTVPAFVNENMLERPLSKLQNYESKQLQARILYVMPMTKHVFLTLANYDGNKATVGDPIAPGTIVEDARIIHKCHSGVWFQIGKKHKGLIPKYILKSKYRQNYDEQIVMAKYQINSVHKVRTIRFEAFDRVTIVTDDEKSIESKFFTYNDVKVGEIYDCRVTSVLDKKRGYLVGLGQIKGIVTSHNFVKTKPSAVNQTIRLRLVAIDEERKMAQFSNHPEYLKKSAKLITSRENIKVGQSYHGTVISEKDKFFVVAFCNKITGILFKFCRDVAQDQDKIARLKLGVVGQFSVHDVSEDGEKITLSIPLTAGSENLGNIAMATVTGVFATGADVYLVKENETGTIPTDMFSDFPEHNAIFANVLKEGERLPVVNLKQNVFSCRDVEYFKRKPTLVKDVKRGQILRAYCVGSKGGKLSLQLALKDYPNRVQFNRNHSSRIDDGQVILVKVTKLIKKADGVLLIVSPKLQEVCIQGADEALRYTQRYVNEVNGLVERFKTREKSFARYTIGQSVICVVESFVDDSDQMIVQLRESDTEGGQQAKAIAVKDPKKSNYDIGDELLGRIVWVDIEKQLVHVCVVKKLLQHITDGELSADMSSDLFNVDEKRDFVTLFSNNYIAVGCLRKLNCPLVVVPVRCHYNDFNPVSVQQNAKVVVVKQFEGLVYGMFEESYEKFKELKFALRNRTEIKKDKACWLPDDFEEPEDDKIDSGQEPLESSDASEKNMADGNNQSDSGIDKDDETEVAQPTAEPLKKIKKKRKKLLKVGETNAVASPGKNLKGKKQKKNADTKKLKKLNADAKTEDTQPTANPSKKSKKKQKKLLAGEQLLKIGGTNAIASPGKILKVNKRKNRAEAKKLKGIKSLVISQLDGADDFVGLKKAKNKKQNHFLSERPTAKAPNLTASKQSGSGIASNEPSNRFEKKDKLQQLAKKTKFKSKQNKKIKIHAESTNVAVKELAKDSKSHHKNVALPGAESFWSVATSAQTQKQESDSSDDDDQPEEQVKKRITSKERFDAMKQEEDRIRKIEEELADASVDPHTPDQFDRLVLAQPNSSLLWIRYMVFHMESAEIEKARSVARRALKTINYREEAERLNVWIALINLELRYETIDKFKEVLLEAIQYNDDYKVYSRVIEVLVDCGKVPEVLEMIETLQKKFRKQPEMWLLIANCYYKIGHRSNVKPLLNKALKSLENKEHIPLIVKFAFLHNRNEERDEAHILFEQILSSYPKRTDIWSQYVDLLVKDGLVDVARQTLDRAIIQRLPMRNMKTLYTKYVNFEEKHGDRESVKKIKHMAADYVKQQLSASGVAGNE